MNQTPTPGPWTVVDGTTIAGACHEYVAAADMKLSQANAAHIVKCVNTYDALVYTLEQVQDYFESYADARDKRATPYYNAVLQALALARGQG